MLPSPEKLLSRNLLDVLIRAGLILLLALFCFRIFHPFLDLMLWSVILAITLYPLHQLLSGWLGGRTNSAATLIVILGLVILLVPVRCSGMSMADPVRDLVHAIQNRTLQIPLPPDSVQTWPVSQQHLSLLDTRGHQYRGGTRMASTAGVAKTLAGQAAYRCSSSPRSSLPG